MGLGLVWVRVRVSIGGRVRVSFFGSFRVRGEVRVSLFSSFRVRVSFFSSFRVRGEVRVSLFSSFRVRVSFFGSFMVWVRGEVRVRFWLGRLVPDLILHWNTSF